MSLLLIVLFLGNPDEIAFPDVVYSNWPPGQKGLLLWISEPAIDEILAGRTWEEAFLEGAFQENERAADLFTIVRSKVVGHVLRARILRTMSKGKSSRSAVENALQGLPGYSSFDAARAETLFDDFSGSGFTDPGDYLTRECRTDFGVSHGDTKILEPRALISKSASICEGKVIGAIRGVRNGHACWMVALRLDRELRTGRSLSHTVFFSLSQGRYLIGDMTFCANEADSAIPVDGSRVTLFLDDLPEPEAVLVISAWRIYYERLDDGALVTADYNARREKHFGEQPTYASFREQILATITEIEGKK